MPPQIRARMSLISDTWEHLTRTRIDSHWTRFADYLQNRGHPLFQFLAESPDTRSRVGPPPVSSLTPRGPGPVWSPGCSRAARASAGPCGTAPTANPKTSSAPAASPWGAATTRRWRLARSATSSSRKRRRQPAPSPARFEDGFLTSAPPPTTPTSTSRTRWSCAARLLRPPAPASPYESVATAPGSDAHPTMDRPRCEPGISSVLRRGGVKTPASSDLRVTGRLPLDAGPSTGDSRMHRMVIVFPHVIAPVAAAAETHGILHDRGARP